MVMTAEKAVVVGRASFPVPFQTPPSCGGLTRSRAVPTPPNTSCGLASVATQTPSVARGVELH